MLTVPNHMPKSHISVKNLQQKNELLGTIPTDTTKIPRKQPVQHFPAQTTYRISPRYNRATSPDSYSSRSSPYNIEPKDYPTVFNSSSQMNPHQRQQSSDIKLSPAYLDQFLFTNSNISKAISFPSESFAVPDARSTESKTPPSYFKNRKETSFSDEEQFSDNQKQNTRITNPEILIDEFPLSYKPAESLSSRPGYYPGLQNSSIGKSNRNTPEYQKSYYSQDSHLTPTNLTSRFDQEIPNQYNKTTPKKFTNSSLLNQDRTSPSYYTSLLDTNIDSKVDSSTTPQIKVNYGSDCQPSKRYDSESLERTTPRKTFHNSNIARPYTSGYKSVLVNKNDYNKPILYYCGVLEDDSNGSDEEFLFTSEQVTPKSIPPTLRTEPVEKISQLNSSWYTKRYQTHNGTPKRENPSMMQMNYKCQTNSTLTEDSQIDTWIDKYPVMPNLRMPSPQHMTNYSYLSTSVPQKSTRERPRIFAEMRKVVNLNEINQDSQRFSSV